MAPVDKLQIASYQQFLGLRTDTPSSKTPQNYSPDCSDMIFSPGGMETRHPFIAASAILAEIVYRKEFTCKDGTLQLLALDINGVLYSIAPDGTPTILDHVTPGSLCSSVTAYGWEYLAFHKNGAGSDAPRRWDGKTISRVSPGAPGAAPVVTNYIIPAVALVTGSSGAPVAITSVTPSDPITVQIGGNDNPGDGGYNPPQYETYNTTLLFETAPHGLVVGEVITVAGNTLYNLNSGSVIEVIDATHFKVAYQTPDFSVGTGGSVTPQAPFLTRTGNVVTANTNTPHNLRPGYKVTIAGVALQSIGGSVTSIVIDNDKYPGVATVTTSLPHGLIPGVNITLTGVANVVVGTSIVNIIRNAGISTLTTTTAHGLQSGATVLVQTGTGPFLPFTVATVVSPTVFTYAETGLPDITLTGGSVTLIWPGNQDIATLFQVGSVPTTTTFQIPINYSDGTWNSGTIQFDWNGTFYVTSVISPTSFTYKQIGPDGVLTSGTGMVTPQGQLAAGDHLVVQHFIYQTGFITGPSPSFKFTASGGQYALAQQLAIGPSGVIGRVLSFTGQSGNSFVMLLVPGQVNGVQVSTSTRIDDNVTTSALMDFSDTTLLSASATRIDVPGNNLFQLTSLNTPRGVRWYGDRLGWIGEKNTVIGFLNLLMDGGTYSGSTLPLGWNPIGTPVVTQVGTMPALVVTGPDTGEVTQNAATTQRGDAILQPNQPYTFRFWMDGAGSHSGQIVATISSATTGFSTMSQFNLADIGGSGYYGNIFPETMPTAIPSDMQLSIKFVGLVGTSTYRDAQIIYSSNPDRNPIARLSYTQNPEAYDAETGNIGPNNDSSELRALFFLGQNLYFITEKGLFWTQQITNSEPSSWYVDSIAFDCGAFNQEGVVTGKGWAAWAGKFGAFWFSGGAPDKTSAIIAPTWRLVAGVTNTFNDQDVERVYFGLVDGDGKKSIMVYDYHEIALGGAGKWCPWNRQSNWISASSLGTTFAIADTFYRISDTPGISDDNLGDIGGYYTFAPAGSSMLQKEYSYMGLEIAGVGSLTPFLYQATLNDAPYVLRLGELDELISPVAEWPTLGLKGRRLWLKLGQPGVQYSLQNATILFAGDPNAPVSGVR